MGRAEMIEAERKGYECDTLWNMRKQFLERHWDDMDRDQLICDANLFINIFIMGCEYSPPVMERIHTMSRGIISTASNQRKLAKASKRHTVKSKLPSIECTNEGKDGAKRDEEEGNGREKAGTESASRNNNEAFSINHTQETCLPSVARSSPDPLDEKLKDMKGILLEADFEASSVEMLNFATSRGKMRYDARPNALGDFEVQINNHIVFSQRFPEDCKEARESAINAVVESFLHAETPCVKGKEIWFGEDGPAQCYLRSVERSLDKASKFMKCVKDFKDLNKVLEDVNLTLEKSIKHLQGWSQELELRCGGLVLLKRVLQKGECVADKAKKIIDTSCTSVASWLSSGARISMQSDGLLHLLPPSQQ